MTLRRCLPHPNDPDLRRPVTLPLVVPQSLSGIVLAVEGAES